jgi:isopenicillin N synthase-like dioxygenase
VPQADVATLYGLAKDFFALPLERKLGCMLPQKTKPYGYIPMGLESVAATLHGEEAPDLCEALVFRRPELDGRDGRTNLWPNMPELKPAVLGYFQTLARLARDLYRLSRPPSTCRKLSGTLFQGRRSRCGW